MNQQTKGPAELMADLTDQVRLLRLDVANLIAGHPTKEDAEYILGILEKTEGNIVALNDIVPKRIQGWMEAMSQSASRAASAAVTASTAQLGKDMAKTTEDLAKAAGEARRQAMRYRGGFWVWLGLACAVGALLVALGAFLITRSDNAKAFGQWADLYCTDAGGQKTTSERGGETYEVCVFWLGKAKP